MKVLAALLAAVAVVIPSASVADPPIQVFLLAGQSNMIGRAMPVSDGTGPTANLFVYRNGTWEQASDPLGPLDRPDSGVGPGMTFGVGVLAHEPPGAKVGLIMCAQSSTPIGYWKQGNSAYVSCKAQASAAGGVVAGVVFLQGEYEATHGTGSRWTSAFDKVERVFEKDFGPVPFVLGQIGDLAPGRAPYAPEVRAAQAAADAKYAQVTLVSTMDLPLETNGVHFTLDSEKELGTRFADAWYTLLQEFPQITDVSPVVGLPGTAVTITGSAFGPTSSVTFGGVGASYTVDGPGQITAIVPDRGVTGLVRVTTPYATVAGTSFAVLPLIDSFSPTSGPPETKVVVNGKALSGATAVTLNGLPVKFKVLSASQVKVWVPTGATSGKIRVTTADGTAESGGTFTVLPPS